MGTTLKLFIASAALIGCQSKVITAAPDPVQPENTLKIDLNSSKTCIPSPALLIKNYSKKYPSMNSPLLKNTYKYCDADKYASIIMDGITGEILYGYNENKPLVLASLTKMVPLFLAMEEVARGRMKMQDRLVVDKMDPREGLAMLKVKPEDHFTVEQAMQGIVTRSAADATDILAKNIPENINKDNGERISDFVKRMKKRALSLDMTSSSFGNTSGAPDKQNIGTARDIAVLGRSFFQYHANQLAILKTPSMSFHGITIKNHALIPGADMGKTGKTDASGFNTMLSFPTENGRLIVVVFGGKSAALRNKHAEDLYKKGLELLPKPNPEISDRSFVNVDGKLICMPLPKNINELEDLIPPKPDPFSLSQNFGLWAAIDKDGKGVFFTPSKNKPTLAMQ